MTSSDRGSAADQSHGRRRLPFRKRAVLVFASLFALGAMLTTAGFTDAEFAEGAVSTGTYDLQIGASETGPWQDTLPMAPLTVTGGSGGQLLPGASSATTVWVKNNGTYWSDLNIRVVRTSGDAALAAALVYTIQVNDGPVVTVPWSDLNNLPGTAGGYAVPNVFGPDQRLKITITATLPADVAGSDALEGKSVGLTAVFLGESVATPRP